MLVDYVVSILDIVSFFFSSRRRHTRYWRDWSSDVCSSDLVGDDDGADPRPRGRRPLDGLDHRVEQAGEAPRVHRRGQAVDAAEVVVEAADRCAERRDGKKGRNRWTADHYKKTKWY